MPGCSDGACGNAKTLAADPVMDDPFDRSLEIEQAQLRVFALSSVEAEWLLLILLMLYLFRQTITVAVPAGPSEESGLNIDHATSRG